jgi:hypothetical protein
MLGVVEDRDQLGLLPVLAAGTTQGLAVHGQHGPILATGSRAACSRPPAKMAASQDPAGQRLPQRGRIDRGEHAPERGRMRRRTADSHRLFGAARTAGRQCQVHMTVRTR